MKPWATRRRTWRRLLAPSSRPLDGRPQWCQARISSPQAITCRRLCGSREVARWRRDQRSGEARRGRRRSLRRGRGRRVLGRASQATCSRGWSAKTRRMWAAWVSVSWSPLRRRANRARNTSGSKAGRVPSGRRLDVAAHRGEPCGEPAYDVEAVQDVAGVGYPCVDGGLICSGPVGDDDFDTPPPSGGLLSEKAC